MSHFLEAAILKLFGSWSLILLKSSIQRALCVHLLVLTVLQIKWRNAEKVHLLTLLIITIINPFNVNTYNMCS